MNSKNHQKLILSLITNDLINHKLTYGLEQLGADVTEFHLSLDTCIFKLMGFLRHERTDDLYKLYYQHCHKVLSVDLQGSRHDLQALALEIYEELCGLMGEED